MIQVILAIFAYFYKCIQCCKQCYPVLRLHCHGKIHYCSNVKIRLSWSLNRFHHNQRVIWDSGLLTDHEQFPSSCTFLRLWYFNQWIHDLWKIVTVMTFTKELCLNACLCSRCIWGNESGTVFNCIFSMLPWLLLTDPHLLFSSS